MSSTTKTNMIWEVTNKLENQDYDTDGVYTIGHFADENAAFLVALGLIIEWAGDWSDYGSDNVANFNALVEAGKFREAISFWNDEMTAACFVYVNEFEIDNEKVDPEAIKQRLRDFNAALLAEDDDDDSGES